MKYRMGIGIAVVGLGISALAAVLVASWSEDQRELAAVIGRRACMKQQITANTCPEATAVCWPACNMQESEIAEEPKALLPVPEPVLEQPTAVAESHPVSGPFVVDHECRPIPLSKAVADIVYQKPVDAQPDQQPTIAPPVLFEPKPQHEVIVVQVEAEQAVE